MPTQIEFIEHRLGRGVSFGTPLGLQKASGNLFGQGVRNKARSFRSEDEAVVAELSERSRKASSVEEAVNGDSGRRSIFGRFLNEVENVSNTVDKLEREILSAPTPKIASALREEAEANRGRLRELLSPVGPDGKRSLYGQILDVIDRGRGGNPDSSNPGVDSGASDSLLSGSSTLLGTDLLRLLGAKNQSALNSLYSDLSKLSADTPQANLGLLRHIEETLAASEAPTPEEIVSEVSESSEIQALSFEVNELTYESAEGLALGLRTLPGGQLIKAAVSGIDLDAAHTLILKPERDDDDKPGERTKRTTERNEVFLGRKAKSEDLTNDSSLESQEPI